MKKYITTCFIIFLFTGIAFAQTLDLSSQAIECLEELLNNCQTCIITVNDACDTVYIDGNLIVSGTISGGGSVDSDWFIVGNDMYNLNSGNVGIGTMTPAFKLDLLGNSNFVGNWFLTGNGDVTGNFLVTGATQLDHTASNVLLVTGQSNGAQIVTKIAAGRAITTGPTPKYEMLEVDMGALDPAIAGADLVGIAIQASGIDLTNTPDIYGFNSVLPTNASLTSTSYAGRFEANNNVVQLGTKDWAIDVTTGYVRTRDYIEMTNGTDTLDYFLKPGAGAGDSLLEITMAGDDKSASGVIFQNTNGDDVVEINSDYVVDMDYGVLNLGGVTGHDGILKLIEDGTGFDIEIQPPTGITGPWDLVLPIDNGNANEFLRTDGNGVTSWLGALLRSANDFNTFGYKSTGGDDNDVILIEDSKDSGNKKYILLSDMERLFLPEMVNGLQLGAFTTTLGTFQQAYRYPAVLTVGEGYYVSWSAEITNTNANRETQYRIQLNDTTTISEGRIINSSAGQYVPIAGTFIISSATATNNFDFDIYRVGAVGTAYIQKMRIQVLWIE